MTWTAGSTGSCFTQFSVLCLCSRAYTSPHEARSASSAQLGLMLHTAIVGGNAGRRIEYALGQWFNDA